MSDQNRTGGPGRTPPLRLDQLPPHRDTEFDIRPDAEARAAIARTLGAERVRKLRFSGRLHPLGQGDWALEGHLGATVVQPCVVTLEPVVTRIDLPVERRYVADLAEPSGEEVEMPEDVTVEPLPRRLDLEEVMVEELALALPDYPRAEGVEPADVVAAPPGAEPIDEGGEKPLAGLAALRDRLGKGD